MQVFHSCLNPIPNWPTDLHRQLKKATIDAWTTLKETMGEAARKWLKDTPGGYRYRRFIFALLWGNFLPATLAAPTPDVS